MARAREKQEANQPTKVAVTAAQMAVVTIGQAIDRLGMPTAIFSLCLAAVWFFGDAATHKDFIREVLFAEVTHTRYVQVFFGALAVIAVLGGVVRRRGRLSESDEMKRLAAEKSKLQERLVGEELSHTENQTQMESQTKTKALEGGGR